MPVVDGGNRLVGVVPAPTVAEILRREHVEDLHRTSGILNHQPLFPNEMETGIWRRVGGGCIPVKPAV